MKSAVVFGIDPPGLVSGSGLTGAVRHETCVVTRLTGAV
jgi:hypothetical protein